MADEIAANRSRNHRTTGATQKSPRKKRARYRSRKHRILIGLSKFVLLAYATVLGTMVLMESRLVYPGAYFDNESGPTHSLPDQSSQSGEPPVERIEYQSTDGILLHGLLVERPGSDNVVLYFHGNGGKASWLGRWLQRLSIALDATVMIAEYRGYEDESTPTEKGVIEDCFAARDYLSSRYAIEPDQIILYGRSLGGGCAVAVASMGSAKALILESTFDRMVDVAAEKYPVLPIRFLMRNRYDSIAKLTAYEGPLIQVHGTEDKTIPIEHGERLFQSARCKPKHWIAVDGMAHNDGLSSDTLSEIAAQISRVTTDQ